MPPHRNVHQGVFESFGPAPFSYGAVPSEGTYNQAFNDPLAYAQRTSEPSSNQRETVDIFEDMAKTMREAFASFESINANASTTAAQAPFASGSAGASATTNTQTTPPNPTDANPGSGFTFQFPSTAAEHGLPRDGPFVPLFTDHQPRPYGFNWSESTTNGAAHPGSMPYSSSKDSGANQHHHHHHHHGHYGGPGGCRGRYTPYGRGGPPPHFHHRHHRPPPFGPGPFPFAFGGPFGHAGPFGFRGPWNRPPPPPPFAAPNMEEEFSRAREQQQESWQKLYEKLNEMRSRMYGATHGHDGGFGAHTHPGRGRGGYQSGRGRYESYAWGSGDGGAPPRSGARSRSAPAPKDVPKPRKVDVAKAWETYSAQWMKLITADAPATIKLSEVPWPVLVDTSKMKTLSDMTSAVTATTVGEFILSPRHSPDVSNKKRIHHALRLYHPDRFEITVVAKLEEKDKKAVRELGEVVAKCLNKLLEKEN